MVCSLRLHCCLRQQHSFNVGHDMPSMRFRSCAVRSIVAIAIVTTACAGSTSSKAAPVVSPSSAPVVRGPSTHLDSALTDTMDASGRVYTIAEVTRRAVALGGLTTPRWNRAIEGCAQLRFVLSAAGRVEPTTIVVTDGSTPALVQGLLRVLPGWRYQPATGPASAPVRQLVNLVVFKRGLQVILAHDRDLLPGDCPRPEVSPDDAANVGAAVPLRAAVPMGRALRSGT